MSRGMMQHVDPAVTICTPSFNRADLVGETLQSVIGQTFKAWEVIVVDDGSTDSSREVVTTFAERDPRIRLIERSRGPRGACTCRNIAATLANGRYLLFLDTDDLLAPFCLEQRVAALDTNREIDFAIFPMLLFQNDPKGADRLWNRATSADDLLRLLRLDPVCQGTGTLWRKEAFTRVGMWDETLSVWQDIELHLRAFAGNYKYKKRFDLPPDILLRETPSSLSRGGYQSRDKLHSRARVAKRAVDLLRSHQRPELIPEVRYYCASVILGAVSSNNLDIARDLRRWGAEEGVLTSSESFRMSLVQTARHLKLDRIPSVRALLSDMTRVFQTDSTVGVIPSTAPRQFD
jgi:glycosyltransferase involved in cell wall biosynthesis